MKIEDLILPGAILIGGYLLFTKFKDLLPKLPSLPLVPPVIPSPWEPILPTPKDIPPDVRPYIPTPPTPIDYGIPWLAIPKAITEFSKPMGPGAPSTMAFLFPPIGILDLAKQLPKLMEATSPKTLSKPSPKTVRPSPLREPMRTGVLTLRNTTFSKSDTGKIVIVSPFVKPIYRNKRGF